MADWPWMPLEQVRGFFFFLAIGAYEGAAVATGEGGGCCISLPKHSRASLQKQSGVDVFHVWSSNFLMCSMHSDGDVFRLLKAVCSDTDTKICPVICCLVLQCDVQSFFVFAAG
jgi:hypothetical protein